VAGSLVDEHLSRPARGNEETALELHGLGTLNPGLSGHNHLNTLCAALHNEADHTIASPAHLFTMTILLD
jgi:hypothetical protein